MDDKTLMEIAEKARKIAYAPYSEFKVGCALLAKSGKVYTGINIENASYSPTNCAERTAFFKAVSEGEHEFDAIAICGGKGKKADEVCAPCGVCRQVMAEFCKGDFLIILGNTDKTYRHTLSELLPLSFSLNRE
ncbi:MAG: cytidine deaminase [Clostridiales bacterium]|nr:cytidine deaminase [Clostridiales bacterium]